MSSVVYPLQVVKGSIAITSDYTAIVSQVIKASVMTKLEERVYQPQYGVDERLFSTTEVMPQILADVRRSIDEGLVYFPGVAFELIGSIGDTGILSLEVVYTVDGTQQELVISY